MILLLACTAPTDTPAPTDTSAPPVRPAWTRMQRDIGVPDLPDGGPVIDDQWRVDSGFGPRLLSLEDERPDFHVGSDMDAPRDTPVLASLDGTVFRIDRASGGSSNRLTLAHPLPAPLAFHGESIDTIYVAYSHLEGFEVAQEDDPVTAGQVVARVGDSGGVASTHLHVEVLLGTHCSLRYSTENPESTCARAWDPAVNPLHLLPGYDPELPTVELVSTDPMTVRISTGTQDQDVNRIETDLGVLDLDLRRGMDARTDAAMDDFDYGWMQLTPQLDHVDPAHRTWTVVFPQDPAWIEVTDVTGAGWRWPPEP